MDMTGHVSLPHPVAWTTTSEAARMMGVHEETVRKMLRTGRLRGARLGLLKQHRWRVFIDSIEQYTGKSYARGADALESVAAPA